MCGVYLAAATASWPVGLSYAASRHRCCGSSSVGSGRSITIASIVSRSNFWSFTLAAASTTPKGPPSPSTSTLSLLPFFPRSVGFLPTFFPPEPGLAQPAIGTLPLPVDSSEFVALRSQLGPDALHHSTGAPTLEPIVDGTLGAILRWQLVPLAAGA